MSSAITMAAVSAVSVGMMAYGMASAPGSPEIQKPPPPPNSVQYDDDGGVISSQTYDAATNTWVTKGRELTEEQKAEKAKVAELRTKMLDNLNTTPEDRVKAYEEYAQSYSDAAHKDIDPRFTELGRINDEQANARGMFGSRAYVDAQNELAKDKLTQDANIADQAVMAKNQLADNDRNYWSNMLQQIDSGARSDALAQSQITKNMTDAANQSYSGVLADNSMRNNSIMDKWKSDQAKSASYINAGSNMAGGLMYLYGNGAFKSGGNTFTGKTSPNAGY
jgi:hypothetical protein